MSSKYLSEDIEVLTGLEPVKRRPGMYTDTTRPNHLAMEVIDNLEQVTRIEFSDVELGQPLDPSLFRFEPPPGADVIGQEDL